MREIESTEVYARRRMEVVDDDAAVYNSKLVYIRFGSVRFGSL